MSELTFLGIKDLTARWGRCKSFVYNEVAAGRLSPSDRGRWPLAEVKRYEREAGIPAVNAAKREAPQGVRTCLYRHFDANGNLLYVGISLSAIQRLSQHRSKSHWSQLVSSVTVEWFPSRYEAEAAELKAIRTELPLHNRAGTT